ncbi:MAG TPA: aminotransferase class V-fold PLP-dependent enzyme [Limnochordia bacterium]
MRGWTMAEDGKTDRDQRDLHSDELGRDQIDRIRAALPVLRRAVYLNAGTAGPVPARAVAAMQKAAQEELTTPRTGESYFRAAAERADSIRRRIAALLGADADEITLTAGTTEGVNIAAWALRWQPGDEIVSANTEHPGGLFPLFALRERFGLTLRLADLMEPPADVVAALSALMTRRTRLIVLSHVAWSTGERYPIEAVAELAHAHGALLLVDGAQGAGAAPLHLGTSGVDFYALPGQKWLLGPEGTGALYVRAARLPELLNTYAGYESAASWNRSAGFLPHPTARRFEVGSRHPVALAGQEAALAWLQEEVGLERAIARIRRLAARLREQLAEVPGVRVLTPAAHAGLVAFQIGGITPSEAVARLGKEGYLVRWIDAPAAVRASCGFYNTEEEIDAFAAAVARLAEKAAGQPRPGARSTS